MSDSPLDLPARVVADSDVSGVPVADPQVGDLVVVHSRGRVRVVKVEKVGPKRVSVVYTTETALREAQKIAAAYPPSRLRSHAEDLREMAAELRAQAEGKQSDEKIVGSDYTTAASALANAVYYEERAVSQEALAEKAVASPSTFWFEFVTVTRKSVSREHVYAVPGRVS